MGSDTESALRMPMSLRNVRGGAGAWVLVIVACVLFTLFSQSDGDVAAPPPVAAVDVASHFPSASGASAPAAAGRCSRPWLPRACALRAWWGPIGP